MKLSKPPAPFKQLNIQGDSVTIDVSAKRIVIPTDNQLKLPSFNQWTENPSRCDLTETPCGGLKNSIVQDKFPGALSIEGDGCYLQNIAGTYTGKSIGAGKLSETTSIKDTGTTGLEFATADGIIFRPGNGVPFLLRPPSCIVDEFKVINISNVAVTYTITIQCPDLIDSIELYNIDLGQPVSVSFTQTGSSYTFSKSIDYNSSEKLQLTIKYQSLEHTTEFTDDANQTIGLQNMSKSWIALIPNKGTEIDIFSFTERPQQLSYKQEADGTISQITLYPGNGTINHSRISHPNHSKVSGTGYIPDCLNTEIEGSVSKFFKSYGMKTDFPSEATITTWVVPAISDTKILPLSTISDDLLGDELFLRMSPGEYGCASFVINTDKSVNLSILASNLISGSNTISASNIDLKYVKCWWQDGYNNTGFRTWCETRGKYITPELLLCDDSLISTMDDWVDWDIINIFGIHNYLKLNNGNYINISTGNHDIYGSINVPITERDFSDSERIMPINISKSKNKQCWITFHIQSDTPSGIYTGIITISSLGKILKYIKLTITVLPILLLPPNYISSIYYLGRITSLGGISSNEKTIEQFTAEQLDMVKHGITSPNLYYQGSNETLIQALQIRSECGIDNTTLYYVGLNESQININSSIESIVEFKALVSSYGVQNLYIYGLDEQDLTPYVEKIDEIHAIGVKIFCAQSYSQAESIVNKLDTVIVSLTPDTSLAALYHDPNGKYDSAPHKILSYYNPQTIPEYPRIFRLNYGLLIWQYDYDGIMDFAYQCAMGDIWDDFDHYMYRDHVFAYPTANGVVDTIQFEGFREGVNDMRYLATLQAAIIAYPGSTATTANNWLTSLKTTDLSTVDLDEVRDQMIDYILQLHNS